MRARPRARTAGLAIARHRGAGDCDPGRNDCENTDRHDDPDHGTISLYYLQGLFAVGWRQSFQTSSRETSSAIAAPVDVDPADSESPPGIGVAVIQHDLCSARTANHSDMQPLPLSDWCPGTSFYSQRGVISLQSGQVVALLSS